MQGFGARLVEHGADFDEARAHAAALAEEEGLVFAPSFAPDLVAGLPLTRSNCSAARLRSTPCMSRSALGLASAG